MKALLKKVWRSLPISIRALVRPLLVKTYYTLRFSARPLLVKTYYVFCALLGIQSLREPIGLVSIPHFAKHYLKRSVAQQGEDLILDRIITRVLGWDINEKRTCVDVGAFHSIEHSVTYLLYRRGWRGVVFDPSMSTEKTFKKWRSRDVFVRAVVGDVDGIDVEFFIPKHSTSDQSLISTKYPDDKENFNVIKHRQVNLNEELKRQGVNNIDVLNIDVEGAEFEILNNFEFDYFSPSVIAVEIHGNDIQKCLETEEAKLILENGYRAVGCAVITFFFVRESDIKS